MHEEDEGFRIAEWGGLRWGWDVVFMDALSGHGPGAEPSGGWRLQ